MRSLDGGPGPGLLPAALGVLMAVLAAWVLFVEPRPAAAPGELRRVGVMAGGLALYAAVLEAVGFVIATAALTVGLLALFNERGRAWLAALGVAGTVTSYWLFHTLLKVQLPADPFGIWR